MENESTFYEDKEVDCVDCKKMFTFTGGEQRFFIERQFTPPKRCKPCRDERKLQRNSEQAQQAAEPIQDDDWNGNGRRNGKRRRPRD